MASPNERMYFAQKVYGIVGAQVGVTALMCLLAINSQTFLNFLATPALLGLSFIGIVVISLLFSCSKEMRSSVPKNYMLLLLFTLFEGHSVAIICTIYNPNIVALATIITAGVFLVVTGYAISTKKDYTISWQIILTIILASLFVGIVRIFYNSSGMEMLTCFMGIICGCYCILYDAQMIFGGHRRAFEIDDYILAALNMYVDLIILFVRLLKLLDKIMGNKKKD